MRSVFTTGVKCFGLSFAVLIFMTMSQGVARADTVTFQGTTDGSFNSTGFSSPATLFNLTFTGSTFPIGTVDTSTSDLLLAGPTLNLGSFTLTGDFPSSTLNTFSLRMVVTFPPGVVGRTQPSAVAMEAHIQRLSDGTLSVDFLHNDLGPFTVELNGNQIESFNFFINDLRIQPGQTVAVVANVEEVPEPATLLMLSTGLASMGAAVLRRRKH